MKYPLSLLNSNTEGALLDARMKLAIELVKTPGFLRRFDLLDGHSVELAARRALDLAQALYDEAEARQLVEPLSESHKDIPQHEVRAIERAARANVMGQVFTQKEAQAAQPTVMSPRGAMNG